MQREHFMVLQRSAINTVHHYYSSTLAGRYKLGRTDDSAYSGHVSSFYFRTSRQILNASSRSFSQSTSPEHDLLLSPPCVELHASLFTSTSLFFTFQSIICQAIRQRTTQTKTSSALRCAGKLYQRSAVANTKRSERSARKARYQS